uniref:Uncharacterized protein n=1 Tax=Timema bartmani TaxID=61472 RepID=A0A7R9I6G7_9NEOP|nr:unnamed protein product [Timema bartmani]
MAEPTIRKVLISLASRMGTLVDQRTTYKPLKNTITHSLHTGQKSDSWRRLPDDHSRVEEHSCHRRARFLACEGEGREHTETDEDD